MKLTFGAAVVVEGGALDDGIDAIVGCDGIGEPAQHHDAEAVAEDGAAGVLHRTRGSDRRET